MSDARERLCCLLRVWQTSAPTLLIPRDMQGVLPCSPGTENDGAHNTIDAQRHVEGLTVWEFNGAYNTVDGNVGAYNTVCVRAVAEVLFLQVYRVWSLVSWFDLCALACFLRLPPWSFPSGRSWSDGPSRSWSRQSEKSGEQGFCEPQSETWGRSRK